MVEVGRYYRMIKKGYTEFRYYIKDIRRSGNHIIQLDSICYDGNSNFHDSKISNSDFWDNSNNFEEITLDQFIMDYKGTQPLPVKSDTFHTLLF